MLAQPPIDSILGVWAKTVLAAETRQIPIKPQVPFRAVRLHVSPECAHFRIIDIRVGNRLVFPTSDPVPASAFCTPLDRMMSAKLEGGEVYTLHLDKLGNDVVGMPLALPTCTVGSTILITVQNPQTYVCDFSAALFGVCPISR